MSIEEIFLHLYDLYTSIEETLYYPFEDQLINDEVLLEDLVELVSSNLVGNVVEGEEIPHLYQYG